MMTGKIGSEDFSSHEEGGTTHAIGKKKKMSRKKTLRDTELVLPLENHEECS